MGRRVIELEAEVADWLEQSLTARFALAAFAVELIAAYGGLRADPRVRDLGGRFPPVQVMRFYADTEPMGLSYCCAPGHRTVLLTVWRTARISEAAEAARARAAARRCGGHTGDRHRDWGELSTRRMSEPGAADTYRSAAAAHAFGQVVHLRRVRRRLTVDDLARAAGTTPAMVVRCETGGLPPTAPPARRIATALSCEDALLRATG